MADLSREPSAEREYLPVASPPRNHGHTTAAWVTVMLVVLGALVSAIAFIAGSTVFFWVGMVIVVVGVVVGRVMRMLGFGQPLDEPSSDRDGATRR